MSLQLLKIYKSRRAIKISAFLDQDGSRFSNPQNFGAKINLPRIIISFIIGSSMLNSIVDAQKSAAASFRPIKNQSLENLDSAIPENLPKNRRISSTTTRYHDEKVQLSFYLASVLKSSMTKLLEDQENVDLILKTEDGSKIGVHSCILQTRCPSFFDRYVKNQENRTSQEAILIPDVNFDSLKFYLKCIYAEDRIPCLVGGEKVQNLDSKPENVQQSAKNDENIVENDENLSLHSENAVNSPKNDENPVKIEENPTSQQKSMDSSTKTFTMMQKSEGPSEVTTCCMTSFVDLATSQNSRSMDGCLEPALPANLSIANSWDGFTTYRIIDQQAKNQQISISTVEKSPKKIFDMYIDLEKPKINDDSCSIFEEEMTPKTVRKSSNHRKRWSITSLKSVDDSMTSNHELSSPVSSIQIVQCFAMKENASVLGNIGENVEVVENNLEQNASSLKNAQENAGMSCSKLASDLLAMLKNELSSDTCIFVENDEPVKAHKCILLATCPAFRSLVSQENTIDLRKFRKLDIKFLLKFLYGGLVDIPEDVDIWRLCDLSDLLQLETLKKVLHLHIKAKFCHYFHKPCPSCSSNILEFCLPNLQKYQFLNDLYAKCLRWQAKYFLRIWKMKSFAALDAENLDVCQKFLHQMINAENVIDILMGCEKLRQFSTNNNHRLERSPSFYENLCTNLYQASLDVLAKNLPLVLGSGSFLELGKGYALNMPLVEDVLPNVIHLLSPEMGCQTLLKLYEILQNLASKDSEFGQEDEYNEKFVSFLKRLYEMCDTHLIHKATEVVECQSWPLLNEQMKERIKEIGIFVDMKKPSAPPPKLSSLNRSYKRSSSSATTTPKNVTPATSSCRDRSLSQRKFKEKVEKTSATTTPEDKIENNQEVQPAAATSASVSTTPKEDNIVEECASVAKDQNSGIGRQAKVSKISHSHKVPVPGSTVQKTSAIKKPSAAKSSTVAKTKTNKK